MLAFSSVLNIGPVGLLWRRVAHMLQFVDFNGKNRRLQSSYPTPNFVVNVRSQQ